MNFLSPLTLAAQDDDILVLRNSYPWFDNTKGYEKAIQVQKQTYEPFIIYFYATWCPYCKKFARNILHSDQVVKALRPIVKVQVDGDTQRGLMRKFGVPGYPCFLVVPKSGEPQQISTNVSISEFLSECKQAGLKIKG